MEKEGKSVKIENMPLAKQFAQTFLKFDAWCESMRGRSDGEEGEGMSKTKGGEKYDLRRVYGSWLLQQPLNKSALVDVTTKNWKSGSEVSHFLFFY